MKSAPFAYVRPGSLDDVVAELADGDAKVLAGGQSLVPVLAMRLGRPTTLVDIGAVSELSGATTRADRYRVGAGVRQRQVELDPAARRVPLLGMAMPFVGHRELRSRGTVCGSLAHADPAAELPAVAACLGAEVEIVGAGGRRTVDATSFVTGAMTTAAGPGDVVVSVSFPHARPGEGFGFGEVARRHGDFALAGVACRVLIQDGDVAEAVLTGFGISDRAVTVDVTPHVAAPGAGLDDALDEIARDAVDTAGDSHGSRDYRRHLFTVLARRELRRALQDARGQGADK